MTSRFKIEFYEEPFFTSGRATPLRCGVYLGCWILIIIATLSLILGLFVPAASAQNMSVSDLGYAGEQTIEIYKTDGTWQGTYNTTSSGIALPSEDFNLVVKPTTSNQNLEDRILDGVNYLLDNWMMWTLVFGAIVFATRKW